MHTLQLLELDVLDLAGEVPERLQILDVAAILVALGGVRWSVSALLWLYVVAGVALPLLGIFAQASTSFLTPLVNPLELLTLDNFKQIFEQPAYVNSIRNSLIIATVGGLLATLFIAFAVLVTNRSDFPLRGALAYVALYPRAIPGIIVSIGFLWTMLLIPGIGGIRNTLIALTVAFTVRFLPIGFGAIMPSVLRISGELDRASRVAGASWLTTMRAILVPLLRPALAAAFVLLFVSFLKEYASALFLVAGHRDDDDRVLAAGKLGAGGSAGRDAAGPDPRGDPRWAAPAGSAASWLSAPATS